jgi:hypothetical protein
VLFLELVVVIIIIFIQCFYLELVVVISSFSAFSGAHHHLIQCFFWSASIIIERIIHHHILIILHSFSARPLHLCCGGDYKFTPFEFHLSCTTIKMIHYFNEKVAHKKTTGVSRVCVPGPCVRDMNHGFLPSAN